MSAALNVVYVAPFGLQAKTTVWARTLPLAEQLVAAGHTATILIPPWDSPQTAGQRDSRNGVALEQVHLTGGLPMIWRRLLTRVHSLQPDIVHIVKPRAYAGLVQYWLWQRRRAHPWRLVLDIDDWEQAWSPVNRYGWALARFLAWQEEWGLRHAHGITAASHWLMDAADHAAPSIPRLYLPNGVTPLATPPTATPRGRPSAHPLFQPLHRSRTGLAGGLLGQCTGPTTRRRTNHRRFAGAAVAGGTVPRGPRSVRTHITWTGYVPTDQLAALYASVTCAVFPAAATPLHQAKCSVRLATTLLHGVPVVASAVGEQSHYGADGAARLVPADASPAEFAAAVVDVVTHPVQRTDLRTHAEAHLLSRYAWPDLARRLMDFYARLLADRP